MVIEERKENQGQIAAALRVADSVEQATGLQDFLLILGLCNSAVPETQGRLLSHKLTTLDGKLIYQSQSPDEITLVETAAANEYVLLRRNTDEVVLAIRGEEHKFKLLGTMEFSSARRRMSVVVQTPKGKILLLTKGADVIVYERLADSAENQKLKALTSEQLEEFSKQGLRTLVCAQRELSEDEFASWNSEYQEAVNHVGVDRDELVEKVCSKIESNLELVGATAIEDKLQEEVPETIAYLLEAGIKLWVLTGTHLFIVS
jgi:magnesium-transporting ATPase (P-type)